MDDIIYKQQAIDAMCDACSDWCDEGVCKKVSAIQKLPSAQPEQKSGRWIAHEGGKFVGFPYMHYECSQCRAFEPTEKNFCPNCGADMRGVIK